MKKRVYLDMDGTIANLYESANWLQRLRNEDKTIFLECAPMTTEQDLFKIFPQEQFEIMPKKQPAAPVHLMTFDHFFDADDFIICA